jgi:hypothetical protein
MFQVLERRFFGFDDEMTKLLLGKRRRRKALQYSKSGHFIIPAQAADGPEKVCRI